MSVGGRVAGVHRILPNVVAVRVCDVRPGGSRGDWFCVHVRCPDDPCPIVPGDQIWWQSRVALWTPKDARVRDVRFDRVGYSHYDFDCGTWGVAAAPTPGAGQ